MFLQPKNPQHVKNFSGNKIFHKNPNNSFNKKNRFSSIALIAVEFGMVTNFQIEAIRRFLRRFLKKKAVLFINIFPNISITKKPNDIRQGRGKGGVKY